MMTRAKLPNLRIKHDGKERIYVAIDPRLLAQLCKTPVATLDYKNGICLALAWKAATKQLLLNICPPESVRLEGRGVQVEGLPATRFNFKPLINSDPTTRWRSYSQFSRVHGALPAGIFHHVTDTVFARPGDAQISPVSANPAVANPDDEDGTLGVKVLPGAPQTASPAVAIEDLNKLFGTLPGAPLPASPAIPTPPVVVAPEQQHDHVQALWAAFTELSQAQTTLVARMGEIEAENNRNLAELAKHADQLAEICQLQERIRRVEAALAELKHSQSKEHARKVLPVVEIAVVTYDARQGQRLCDQAKLAWPNLKITIIERDRRNHTDAISQVQAIQALFVDRSATNWLKHPHTYKYGTHSLPTNVDMAMTSIKDVLLPKLGIKPD